MGDPVSKKRMGDPKRPSRKLETCRGQNKEKSNKWLKERRGKIGFDLKYLINI
jgi:hypothetical protein